MDTPTKSQDKQQKQPTVTVSNGSYGLAFVGALVYFLGQASTIGEGIVGIGKAILWPAFLIYHLLTFLNM